MNVFRWICLFGLLAGGICLGASEETTRFQVDKILKVTSPVEFECTLKDYPHAKAVRFKVQIPDLKLKDDDAIDRQAVLFLEDLFSKAGTIQLTHVKVRNYFRLKADVLIDDSDVAQLYVANQMATLTVLPKQDQSSDPKVSDPSEKTLQQWTRHRLGEPALANVTEPPAGRRVQSSKKNITVSDLLDAQVDLSMINDQTPLEEALDIMTHSVEPTLPLVVLWNDLETNALIDRDMPIGVSGFGQIRLGLALNTILHSVSTSYSDLVLAPRENILLLGTRQGLQYKPTTRVYSITDLSALPSFINQFGNSSGSGRANGTSGRSSGSSGRGTSGR